MTELDTIVCRDALALMDGLPAQSVDAIITDMPYEITQNGWDSFIPFDEWWPLVWHCLTARGPLITTSSQPFTSKLVYTGLQWFRDEWIWIKTRASGFLDAPRRPMRNHESVIVFGQKRPEYNPQMRSGYVAYRCLTASQTANYGKFDKVMTISDGDRYPITTLEFSPETGLHPTQKPVALYEYLIKTYTNPGAVVLDPFCGSGTTAIAARNTGRHFICGDISPEYVAIAQKRLRDSDPYQPSEVADGVTQLSLFGE